MRKVKLITRNRVRKCFPDGTLQCLPVDQFPCHRSNFNAYGFPNNDIQLLKELSAKGGINNDRFAAAAARLNVIRSVDNSKKTIDDLWKDWRPSWYQSPTELQAFESWYLEQYPFEKPVSSMEDVSSDVKPEENSSDSV